VTGFQFYFTAWNGHIPLSSLLPQELEADARAVKQSSLVENARREVKLQEAEAVREATLTPSLSHPFRSWKRMPGW
jgi:hypothetical protein